ncbi:MAG: hypothetical protein WD738_12260 [Pirellulales bacterium]
MCLTIDRAPVLPLSFGLLLSLIGVFVDERIQRCIGGHQGGVGHHPALVFHQPLLLALRDDLAEDGLENVLAVAVTDAAQ